MASTVWGIHTQNDGLFLNDNVIAIGWKDFGDLSLLDATREAFKTHYILAHRDFSNGYTAQFVIERDRLYTRNGNLPHGHGELQLNRFEPFPKNPPISKVFREIGYADELGSGMRNTYKYTKLYSGGIPIFVEDNNFEISIPIEKVAELQVGAIGTQDGIQDGTQEKILELIAENSKVTRKVMAEQLNISVRTLQRILNQMTNVQYVGTGVNGHWEIKR
ncbi:MAG: winged helix-turn-helix transcriptional regulator [Lachnospiraceae bacterium]|nr:winged helix-turn-helix transcriptional regulator [Lachnospiraceae bacterium]